MAYNRELSQFASLITVDDSTSVVGIDTFVGIGTTNPTSTLTVQGNTLITGITTTGSLSIGSTQVISSARQLQNIVSLDATTTATIESAIQSAPNTFTDLQVTGISTFTNGPILIGSGTSTGTASQRLQVTGGAYFAGVGTATGSIGVGITNPQGAVDIRTSPQWSSFNYAANLVIGGTRNNGLGILDSTNSNPWAIANNSGNLIFAQMPALGNIAIAATEAARITTNRNLLIGALAETGTASQKLQVTGGAYVSGSVGIGTTNPSAVLDVRGNPWFSPNTTGVKATALRLGRFSDSASAAYDILTDDAVGDDIEIQSNRYTGNLKFSRSSPSGIQTTFTLTSHYQNGTNISISDTTGTTTKIRLDEAGNTYFNNTGAVLVGTATSTGTSSQTLQVTGGAYVSGNLGVGVTNPGATLHVTPTSTSIAGLFSGTTSSDMVRITQLGSGNALVVEDESNPDATPFVVTASGSVGVGTISPLYGIHIQGSSIAEIGFTATGAGGDNFRVGSGSNVAGFDGFRIYDVNASAERLRVDSSGNVVINNTVATGTASQPLQVTGGAYVSGNLGVGVTNPGAKLVVDGDVRLAGLDAEIEFNTGGARLKGRSNALSIHTGGGLDTETSEQVRINTTGVGIGTTNPGTKLNVVDNSSSDAVRITQLGAGNAFVVEDSTNPDATPFVVNASGSVGVGTTNPTSLLHLGPSNGNTLSHLYLASINNAFGWRFDTQDFGGGSVPLRIFRRVNGTDTEAITVLNQSGNVGLGSTLPTAALTIGTVGSATTGASQIYLNGATSNRIDFNQNGIAAPASVRSVGTKIVLYPSLSGSVDYALGIESSHIWQSVPGGSGTGFKWYGGTTQLAILRGDGNLGIGTTNPVAPLHIASAQPIIRFAETDAAANNRNWDVGVNNQEFYWQAIDDAGSGGGNSFKMTRSNEQIQTFEGQNGGVTWFRVDNNTQRVGIGTTNPGARLQITPTSTGVAGLFSGTTSSDMVRITQLGSGNALVVEDESNPDATPFVVTASGSVGIGTTNPQYKTHIVDTAATGAGLLVQGGGQGSPIARFERTVGATGLLVDVNASGGDPQIVFNRVGVTTFAVGLNQDTGGTDVFEIASSNALGTNTRFVIDSSNGNVGIGTTNPTSKLHVNGDTLITGILTATNGIQGEAFESYEIDLIGYTGYNLRTEETQIDFTETNDTTTDPYLWETTVTLPIEDNGFTEDNTFIPFFNSEVVSLANPFRLMITVNGVLQSAFINNTDYVYQSNFLGSRNGYTIDSDNNIKFTESIPTGSDIVARVLPVSGTATKIKNYPFKPTDIVLGY